MIGNESTEHPLDREQPYTHVQPDVIRGHPPDECMDTDVKMVDFAGNHSPGTSFPSQFPEQFDRNGVSTGHSLCHSTHILRVTPGKHPLVVDDPVQAGSCVLYEVTPAGITLPQSPDRWLENHGYSVMSWPEPPEYQVQHGDADKHSGLQ